MFYRKPCFTLLIPQIRLSVWRVHSFLPICKLCLRPARLPCRRSRTAGTARTVPVSSRARRPVRERRTVQPRPGAPSSESISASTSSACREHGRTARRSAPFRQSTRFCFRGRAHASSCTSRLSCPAMCAGVTARTKAMPAASPRCRARSACRSRAHRQKNPAGAAPRTDCPFLGQQQLRGNPVVERQQKPPVPIGPLQRLVSGHAHRRKDTDSALRQSPPRPPTATHPG